MECMPTYSMQTGAKGFLRPLYLIGSATVSARGPARHCGLLRRAVAAVLPPGLVEVRGERAREVRGLLHLEKHGERHF